MSEITEREQFAESGANIIVTLQRELDRGDLTDDQRRIYTTMQGWTADLTARWVQAMQHADECDAILFGASPQRILHALRQHCTPAQLAELGRLLPAGD